MNGSLRYIWGPGLFISVLILHNKRTINLQSVLELVKVRAGHVSQGSKKPFLIQIVKNCSIKLKQIYFETSECPLYFNYRFIFINQTFQGPKASIENVPMNPWYKVRPVRHLVSMPSAYSTWIEMEEQLLFKFTFFGASWKQVYFVSF